MSQHTIVKELPLSERPYEKLLTYGAGQLSDAELLAIIIKTGTRDLNSLDIARMLLSGGQGNLLNLYEFSYERLKQLPGIGAVKAIQLKAVAELSKRIAKTNRGYHIRMNDSFSVADYYMEELRHLSKEIVIAAMFDAKGIFIGDEQISIGSTTYVYVSPKDIYRKVLEHNATIFIMIHNHPSGDPTPSKDDISITQRMQECAKLLEISFADHIIIGDNDYFSFQEQGLL